MQIIFQQDILLSETQANSGFKACTAQVHGDSQLSGQIILAAVDAFCLPTREDVYLCSKSGCCRGIQVLLACQLPHYEDTPGTEQEEHPQLRLAPIVDTSIYTRVILIAPSFQRGTSEPG